MTPELRFYSAGHLPALLERQTEVASRAVRSLDPEVVLSTPLQDLVDLLYEKYRVEPIVLDLASRRSSGAKDVSIPFDSWSGRTIDVDRTRVEVLIPITGDEILLDVSASTSNLNPPRFEVRGNNIVAAYEGRAPLNPQQAKAAIDQLIASIEQQLQWQRADIDPLERAAVDLTPKLRSTGPVPQAVHHAGHQVGGDDQSQVQHPPPASPMRAGRPMRTAAGSVRESVRLPARFTSNCAGTTTETSSGVPGRGGRAGSIDVDADPGGRRADRPSSRAFTAGLRMRWQGRCGQMTSRHPGQLVRLRPITPCAPCGEGSSDVAMRA